MNKNNNIQSMLDEFKEEQDKLINEKIELKEKQFNKKFAEQNKKNKRLIVLVMVLALLFSGVSSVFSYSFGASSVAYTPTDSNWQVGNAKEAIDDLYDGIGSALIGAVYSYMGASAPRGYLACDGSVYRITDYQRLANHIYRSFGSYNFFGGDGTTTFAVPDLRGEFLRGTGVNSHTNQGSGTTVGTHQDSTIIVSSNSNEINALMVGKYVTDSSNANFDKIIKSGSLIYTGNTTTNADDNRGFMGTIRPTNTSVLYIIKY